MLIDSYGRIHDYLRISVTERCNLRCTYCMPANGVELGARGNILTGIELESLAAVFVDAGIRKIRITGGEPLVRKDIDGVLNRLGRIDGLEEFALSTNGVLLKEKLPMVFAAGVRQLNISLDTLQESRFEDIALRSNYRAVLDAIYSAIAFRSSTLESFDSVKINVVVMRGVNDNELKDFVRFGEHLTQLSDSQSRKPTVEIRFIEFMPFLNNRWNEERSISYAEMLMQLQGEFTLVESGNPRGVLGPAKRFRILETNTSIGFITSMSEHFCASCNRLRLTADGMLRTCLFGTDGVNLRSMLRSGCSNEAIQDAIRSALSGKWEKHEPANMLVQIGDRDMVQIGG